MKKLSGGLINTIYLDDGRIKKIYSDNSLIKGLGFNSRQRMHNELVALRIFSKELPCFVPKIIEENKDKKEIVIENIEGNPIEQLLIETKVDLTYKNLDLRIANILKTIHGKVIADNTEIVKKYNSNFSEFFNNSKAILEYENVDTDKLLKIISSYVKLDSFIKANAVFIHGDFWLDNMLFSKDDHIYVIDWEFSGMGFSYEDLGIFFTNVDMFFQDGSSRRFYQNCNPDLDFRLIKLFCFYRCMRLLSFIDLDIYKSSPENYNHSFKSLVKIVKKLLSEL